MSQATKNALSASLIKLMSQHTLDKITVSDVTSDCGVNRQTFYYHFKDIYDLVEWTYSNAAEKLLNGKNTYATWQDGCKALLEKLVENKSFVMNTYNSISRDALERAVVGQLIILIRRITDELSARMSVSEEDKNLITRFFVFGFIGMMIEWLDNGMKTSPDEFVENINRVVSGDISSALVRCRTDNPLQKQT